MADWSQFEGFEKDMHEAERPAACQVCEAMLPDAVDGVLSEAEQWVFDRHVAGCVVCSQELEEAQRGAAWLGMLKQQTPEPSPMLLERILAQTIGKQAANAPVIAAVPVAEMPVWAEVPRARQAGGVKIWAVSMWQSVRETATLEWMKPLLQPRMAMTAAMAFFSVALTLNLTGVKLSELNASSLRPSSLRRTVADRTASAVRSFQNLPVVYQAEAQVNELRTTWDQAPRNEGPQTPQPEEEKPKPKQDVPQGSSKLDFEPVNPQGAGITRKGA